MLTDITIDDLPKVAKELADIIGLAGALAVVDHWGGVGLWVPVDWNPDDKTTRRLISVLGDISARKLWEIYHGSEIDVPKCERAMRAARDTEIRARYRASDTAARLAREYNLTERQIYNIVGIIADKNQMGLFAVDRAK